jgi:hypothetical protein
MGEGNQSMRGKSRVSTGDRRKSTERAPMETWLKTETGSAVDTGMKDAAG